jgi:Sporulation and spore germination
VSKRSRLYIAAVGVVALALIGRVIAGMMTSKEPAATPAPAAAAAPAETAHITATLYYASSDGASLVPVRRDVPLASGVVEQGRQILLTAIKDAPQPYVKVIPEGTTLRAFYVTDRGDAFVDFGPEIVRAHPGGSLNELLTVYSIVNSVTANLPAVQRVQLLVDGKEIDAIAGHVDIRRPLTRDMSLVRERDTTQKSKPTTQKGGDAPRK